MAVDGESLVCPKCETPMELERRTYNPWGHGASDPVRVLHCPRCNYRVVVKPEQS
jgi:uncharacterized protein YbaR (Trm112 family)